TARTSASGWGGSHEPRRARAQERARAHGARLSSAHRGVVAARSTGSSEANGARHVRRGGERDPRQCRDAGSVSKPPIIFSLRWWRMLWLITREYRRGVKKGSEIRAAMEEAEHKFERDVLPTKPHSVQIRYWKEKSRGRSR